MCPSGLSNAAEIETSIVTWHVSILFVPKKESDLFQEPSTKWRMFSPLILIPCTHGVARLLLGSEHRSETRWWCMHVLCNVVVGIMVWPDLVATISHPSTSAHLTSRNASVFAVCVHAYHAIVFPLSWDDRMHHTVFAGLMGIITSTYPSHASNACLIFLSGLPGGLLYTLLVARRCGHLRQWNEPVISAVINVCIRLLGILVCLGAFVISSTSFPTPHRPPVYVALLQVMLCLGNGVYYTNQSVRRALRGRRSQASST